MIVVPRVNTPLSLETSRGLLRATFPTIMGREATQTELVSLLALIWIETGRGADSQNHNVGNISASERFSGKVWRPPWFDFDGGKADTPKNRKLHEAMLRHEVPSAFRAYDSFELGMIDYLTQIKSTFPEVLEASKLGDPDAFRVALSKKYSGDYRNVKATDTFAGLFREFGLPPKAGAGAGAPPSLSRPGSVPLPSLRRGLYGPAVRLLGALLGVDSDEYGTEMVSAVKTFQRSNALLADGVCGPITWGVLIAKTPTIGLAGRMVT